MRTDVHTISIPMSNPLQHRCSQFGLPSKRPLMLCSKAYIPLQAFTPKQQRLSHFTLTLTRVGFTTYTPPHISVTHAHRFYSRNVCDLMLHSTPDKHNEILHKSIFLKIESFEQILSKQKISTTSDERSLTVHSSQLNFSQAAGSLACFSMYNSPDICS